MKKIILSLIIIILFLSGISLVSYPVLANLFSSFHHGEAIQEYKITVKEFNDEKMKKEYQKARDYNAGLNGIVAHDPFVEGSGYTLPENYVDCLNINGIMGTLIIPKINVNLPIYHGTPDEVLRKGVGHIKESSLPIGGAGTHAVLTSHSGLQEAKLFTDLDKLVEGDTFEIDVLNQKLYYQVDQIKIVEPNQTEDLKAVSDKDYVTLLTCTPIGVNSHRLLVRGFRIYPGNMNDVGSSVNVKDTFIVCIMFFISLISLLIIYYISKNKKGIKHDESKR